MTFNASASSMSLDQLLIDTALQPRLLGFFNEPNPISSGGVEGDYNNSGSVEQGDLDIVLSNWGGPRGAWSDAEGFTTPTVDQEELDRVLSQWGASASPSFGGGLAILGPALALPFLTSFVFGMRRRGRSE
ncbi:MAG: hypothetical protein AAF663_04460 [Planctomycetota bacterium]